MRVHQIAAISLLLFIGAVCAWGLYYFKQLSFPSHEITLYGNVDVRQVDLGFRVFGRVDQMPFEEGDFVEEGTFMASIEKEPYADQAKEAKARVNAIAFGLSNAEQIYLRREALVEEGGVSQEDYDNALTARNVLKENLVEAVAALGVAETNLADTEIFCPSNGIILTRVREPGSVVLQSEPVYTLSLISPVWVRAYVPEPLLGVIYPGMEADIYTDTKNGQVYHGKIGFISPVAEFTPKTVETTELRTDLVYRIRIYADNPDWGLKQGMPVTVKLKNGNRTVYPR